MTRFILVAGIVLLFAVFLILLRALRGPTIFDRILAINALGTKTVVLVAVIGFISERADFLDIALLYALMNFTSPMWPMR
jgi:multicomponent Na+:H+ antiporter subunit F